MEIAAPLAISLLNFREVYEFYRRVIVMASRRDPKLFSPSFQGFTRFMTVSATAL